MLTFICKEPNIGFHSHLRFGLMGMQTKLRCREKRAPRCYKNIVLYAPTACSLVHFHVVLIKFEKTWYFIFSLLSLFWLLSPYNNLYQTFRNIQPNLYSMKESDYSGMRKTFSRKNLNIRQVFINRFCLCLLLSYSFKPDVIEGSVARYWQDIVLNSRYHNRW